MRGRWVIPAVLVLALCAGVMYAWQYAARRTRQVVKEAVELIEAETLPSFETGRSSTAFDLGTTKKLTIENAFGDVEVMPGGLRVSVESIAYARGKTAEDASRHSDLLQIKEDTDADHGRIVRVEAKEAGPGLAHADMDLRIEVPADTDLSVRVTAGDATVSGLSGKLEVHGQSGRISITDSACPVTASATAGDIEITNATAGVTANSSSGAVFVEGAEGDVTARTMNGMLTVRVARSDKVYASTMSGDIDVRVVSPFSGKMEVRSMNGDIVVAIPARSNCRVRTATNTGGISSSLSLRRVERAGPNISGQLGAGKGSVEVTNNSGDITIKPAEETQ